MHEKLSLESGSDRKKEKDMAQSKYIADYLSLNEIKMKMQMTAGFMKMQKWLVIYNVLADPRSISEIAMHTGLSEGSVHRIIEEYNRLGPDALENGRVMMTDIPFEYPRENSAPRHAGLD
jgi:hypothetical protein